MKLTKVILATALVALMSVGAMAQTEAGKFMMGANTSMSLFSYKPTTAVDGVKTTANKAITNFNLKASGSYFVIDNLGIGAGLSYEVAGRDGESNNTFIIAPNASYYFMPGSSFRPYISAEVGYAMNSEVQKKNNTTETTTLGGLHYGVYGGLAYFFTDNFGLNFQIGYASSTLGGTVDKVKYSVTNAGVASSLGFLISF